LREAEPLRPVAAVVVVLVVADPVDVRVARVHPLEQVGVTEVAGDDPGPHDVVDAQLPEPVVDVPVRRHVLRRGAVGRGAGVHLQVEGEEDLLPGVLPVLLDAPGLDVDDGVVQLPGRDLLPRGLLLLRAAPPLALPGQQQHPVRADRLLLRAEQLPLPTGPFGQRHVVVRVHDVQLAAHALLVGRHLLREVVPFVRHERAEPGAARRLQQVGGTALVLGRGLRRSGGVPQGEQRDQDGADDHRRRDQQPAPRRPGPRPGTAVPAGTGGVRAGGGRGPAQGGGDAVRETGEPHRAEPFRVLGAGGEPPGRGQNAASVVSTVRASSTRWALKVWVAISSVATIITAPRLPNTTSISRSSRSEWWAKRGSRRSTGPCAGRARSAGPQAPARAAPGPAARNATTAAPRSGEPPGSASEASASQPPNGGSIRTTRSCGVIAPSLLRG